MYKHTYIYCWVSVFKKRGDNLRPPALFQKFKYLTILLSSYKGIYVVWFCFKNSKPRVSKFLKPLYRMNASRYVEPHEMVTYLCFRILQKLAYFVDQA